MALHRIDPKWWVLIAIGTGTFMSALDGSVVNTILPVLREHFTCSVATIEWVVTVYLLVLSGLLLTFGRLGDLRGHKAIYVWGFVIFVLSSAACGFASSAMMLIIVRGIQAVGAAVLASNSPAILTGNFPASQRGQALGLSATMTYLGLTVGPSLGGWISQQFSWRFVFYINVPVGTIALLLSIIFIPNDKPEKGARTFDLGGALTFMLGLMSLMLGLNKGADWGWFSWPVLLLFFTAVLLTITFILIERRISEPMLDLRLFRAPIFTSSTISAVLNYICVYSIIFLTPFFLIQGRGLNPAQAGLLLTSQPLIMAIVAPISGTLSDKHGPRLPTMLGMAILAVGLFTLSRITLETPYWFIAAGLAISGLGTGIFISPNNSALMGSAPGNRQGIAAGILASSRNVGMVLGVGLAGAILTSYLAREPDGFFTGIQVGFLAAAGISMLGILVAAAKEH